MSIDFFVPRWHLFEGQVIRFGWLRQDSLRDCVRGGFVIYMFVFIFIIAYI